MGINCSNCNCAWNDEIDNEIKDMLASQYKKGKRENSISLRNNKNELDPQNLENLQGLSKNSKPTNFNNTLLKNLNYIIILQRTVRKYLHKIKSKKKVSIYPIANGINLNTKHIFSKPNTNQNEDQFENGTKINFKPHHRANQSSIRFKTHLSRPSLECSLERKFTVPLEKTTQYVENFRIENALYTGDLLNGMRHGKGVQIWDDGAKYEGEWLFDKANGLGTFYHVDGDIYQGQWENDRANGEGTYINADGARYQGAWVDDIQEGYGVEVWNDGSSYKGYYHEGKKHGFGIYNWADGSMFEGEWRDNKLNGNGVYTWNDGRLFKGDFKDNFMHGEGHYKWGDGREYKGSYYNDKKHGFGCYKWADKRKYIGFWENGKQSGYGKYILAEGSEQIGFWDKGKRTKWLNQPEINNLKAEPKFSRLFTINQKMF